MTEKSELLSMLRLYKESMEPEYADIHRIFDFITRHSEYDLYDRRTGEGHITASAVLFSAADDRILLLYHRSLNKWLQPGGHIERSDNSVLDAAVREISEETSLARSSFQIKACANGNLLLNVSSHPIPANERKSEGGHFHHDLMFLFVLEGRFDVAIDPEESSLYRWFSLEEAAGHCGIPGLRGRLEKFMI